MRIAILLTSNDTSDFARRFPDDGQKFIALMKPFRPDWDYTVFPVIDDVFPEHADDFDGYVITGSPASVHDPFPWVARLLAFIREIIAQDVPLIGACYGHQAIALALGGEVGTNPQGWVVGTAETEFEPQDWMEPPHHCLTLHAAHKEQVSRLPEGAKTIGITPGCPFAAFTIGTRVMTTQYHPEMSAQFMNELIVEMGNALTLDQAKLAHAQIATGEQGAVYGEWMVRFLERG
ncbi:MAG: gamma-glutamyl-gamma-aminobutyrate hydrolase family protein [Pseudomonadota bacterium]